MPPEVVLLYQKTAQIASILQRLEQNDLNGRRETGMTTCFRRDGYLTKGQSMQYHRNVEKYPFSGDSRSRQT